MSDFLTSLIDRATSRTPVLQRRRPSLFEPILSAQSGPAIEPDVSQPVEHDAELERNVEDTRDTVRTPSIKRRPPRAASPAKVECETLDVEVSTDSSAGLVRLPSNHRAPREKNQDTFEEPPVQKPVSQRTPALEISETIGPASARQSKRDALTPTTQKNGSESERVRSNSPVTSREGKSRETPPTKPASPTASLLEKLPVRTPEKVSVLSPKAAPFPRLEPSSLTRRPRPELKSNATQASPPPPPLPPIQITIGRLEVRAHTTPEIPRGARKNAEPRLSLDDYLRDRNGGAR